MGFERAPETSLAQLRAFCQDELLIGASSLGPFVRRLPSAQRRWLERHALAVAAAGFLALWAAGLTVLWTYLS